ncbi:MAG: prepilin-type N-terminal cleavage/methylation domain-containing protein [Candidatus Omnitrophica bacterium]|nr:prepilin-type N-terminal cleavage/methylation domain-containing protein [Candidatus Omnitrophota bacterium]
MSKKGKLKAFTLIELLVVLLIAGVITAIAVPYCWGGYSSAEVKTSSRTIASTLRRAKVSAEAQGKRYRVDFTPSGNCLDMDIYTDLSSSTPTKVGKTEKIKLSSAFVITTTFTDAKAIFTSHGTSNGGTVEIKNLKKGKSIKITVLSNTARIKVKDYEEYEED